jgi:hypothetical protein
MIHGTRASRPAEVAAEPILMPVLVQFSSPFYTSGVGESAGVRSGNAAAAPEPWPSNQTWPSRT